MSDNFDIKLAEALQRERVTIHPEPIPVEKGERLKDLYFKYIKDKDNAQS